MSSPATRHAAGSQCHGLDRAEGRRYGKKHIYNNLVKRQQVFLYKRDMSHDINQACIEKNSPSESIKEKVAAIRMNVFDLFKVSI